MDINKLKNESIKQSKDEAPDIDEYLFGDDNELKENELAQGIDIKNKKE